MRSAARNIAWEFSRKHRWGFLAIVGYLVVAAIVKLLIVEPGAQLDLPSGERFAVMVMAPLTTIAVYLIVLFSFGMSGDLAARQSIYPARMFTRPVTTAALAGWPMLYGTLAMTILWAAWRITAVLPSEPEIPVIWPPALGAVMLSWTQALTWMPYGLRGLRVIVAMLIPAAINAVVLLAIYLKASEVQMMAFLVPQVPIAYLVARVAVARARRGDVPDWGPALARLISAIAPKRQARRHHFRSAEHAQFWFEWRRHGWSLPASVGILLPFELSLLFLTGPTPALVFFILLGVMLTPPFMAAFAAAMVGTASPFANTRPLTSAALIGAKLKMTIMSTLAAWLLVLVAVPLALEVSGTLPVVEDRARGLTYIVGTPRTVVFLLLLLAGFVTSTWRQLVQSLYIGLSGREWVSRTNAVVLLAFLVAIGPAVVWFLENADVRVALWNALPLILAVLACGKMAAATWVATRLYRSRLLSDRTLVAGAACWVAAVFALYALLGWLTSGPLIPRYFLALAAILMIPLSRLSAAPLALAWNRHR